MANPIPPDPVATADSGDSRMSFFEHLAELRKRIVISAVSVLVGAMLAFGIADKFLAVINRPFIKALAEAHRDAALIVTSPTAYMRLYINVSIYLGLILASPVVFYQVWLFVAPGLYKHEKKAVSTFIACSLGLFFTGIAFGYVVMLPYVLKFLITFQPAEYKYLPTVNDYFDFVVVVLLGLGLIFELPVLIFFLALFNIVTPKFLWKNFRYAVLVIAIVAAVVTPSPDATTMLVFMAPMILLYLIGIGVSAFVVRRKRRAALAEGAH